MKSQALSFASHCDPSGWVVWFTPGLDIKDAFTAYWMRQAVLRLRREICWAWRMTQTPDPLTDALERMRLHEQRIEFFERDPTARHLSEAISQPLPVATAACERGSFPWIVAELGLHPAEIFVTALILMNTCDAAAGEVIGAAQGDARRSAPTLGLAQRLWDEPGAFTGLTSLSHALFRMGVIAADSSGGLDWRTPLTMPAPVARHLIAPQDAMLQGMVEITGNGVSQELPLAAQLIALRASEPIASPYVIPLRTASGRGVAAGPAVYDVLEQCSRVTGRPVYAPLSASIPAKELVTAATLCWLRGVDLLLSLPARESHDASIAPFTDIPIYVFVASEQESLELSGWRKLPALEIGALNLEERLNCWKRSLPEAQLPPADVLEDCAFRFRFDQSVIEEIARTLAREGRRVTRERLIAACRQRAAVDPGSLAVLVRPRFRSEELILPPAQQSQFNELITAMCSLSAVHARWGTGRVWDEAGISALFAGPPGTGKTMAAEVLAERLGLPMYRVDLSQVVNKYIGETEKNLRRLFDTVEESDALLFFDEADALFGQRMQVRNAHDRYANLEVSYLLQRMERFRGLAILATNRRKDLDEAFLRRLRFVIEFPPPDAPERRRIWSTGIPHEVDASDLDFDFLSNQFALTGGHIRSIILHACLQSAGKSKTPRLSMETVMRSVKREYEKLDRTLTREQSGRWSELLEKTD